MTGDRRSGRAGTVRGSRNEKVPRVGADIHPVSPRKNVPRTVEGGGGVFTFHPRPLCSLRPAVPRPNLAECSIRLPVNIISNNARKISSMLGSQY